jgi:hypothetical protein
MQIPHPPAAFLTNLKEKNKKPSRKTSMTGSRGPMVPIVYLICRCAGRVGEGNQFADGILFPRKRDLRFRVEDGEHSPAVNSSQMQAVGLNAHHPIFLVEN